MRSGHGWVDRSPRGHLCVSLEDHRGGVQIRAGGQAVDPADRRGDHRRRGRRLAGRHPDQVGAGRSLMNFGSLGQLQNLVLQLSEIANFLFPFAHPTLIVKTLLDDSVGLLLKVGFGFILHPTDFETGHDFTSNSTIQAFEHKVQLSANGALAIVAIWASYRIMWGHGLRSQYTARILLPRLLLSVVLINFALPMLQAGVRGGNTAFHGLWGLCTPSDCA